MAKNRQILHNRENREDFSMETYEKLVLDVVLFEGSDVITFSTGGVTTPILKQELIDEEM